MAPHASGVQDCVSVEKTPMSPAGFGALVVTLVPVLTVLLMKRSVAEKGAHISHE
jgi:hypothetical protein